MEIMNGATVIRKADRGKERPTVGTVKRIIQKGGYYMDTIRSDRYVPRYQAAVVEWHGNVRYLSGRRDQRSTVKLDALVAVDA